MLPLIMAKPGEPYVIQKITGKDEARQHLAELGFVVGEKIEIITSLGGNMIVSVKKSRIALDKKQAAKIIIERGITNEDVEGCKNWRNRNRGKALRGRFS